MDSNPKIFISYSHNDTVWLNKINLFLTQLYRKDEINIWSDQEIGIGDRWNNKILNSIDSSKIVLLLVSPYFLASEYIRDVELPAILKLEKEGKLLITWICLSACLYQETEISHFQCTHNPNISLDSLSESEQNALLVKIINKVKDSFIAGVTTSPPLTILPKANEEIPPDNWFDSKNNFIKRFLNF